MVEVGGWSGNGLSVSRVLLVVGAGGFIGYGVNERVLWVAELGDRGGNEEEEWGVENIAHSHHRGGLTTQLAFTRLQLECVTRCLENACGVT